LQHKKWEPVIMAFELPSLPYAKNALEPHTSAHTLELHHGKHHKAYVDNLNRMVAGSPLEGKPLEAIIRETHGDTSKTGIFNNAAQVWNHTFFWSSMKPHGGGRPSGNIASALDRDLGGFDKFKETFATAATGQFGSGWAWLVSDKGTLKVTNTSNAANPMVAGQTALLCCDVWEHAYYVDYENRRPDFVKAFLEHLANWDFANENLSTAK
jgi:Fe-Mn family superoxide dismutase